MYTRQEFAFAIDRDMQKLVTVLQRGRSIDVTVRYTTEVVIQEATVRIGNVTEASVTADALGVKIAWRAPLVPGLWWPMVSWTRRF